MRENRDGLYPVLNNLGVFLRGDQASGHRPGALSPAHASFPSHTFTLARPALKRIRTIRTPRAQSMLSGRPAGPTADRFRVASAGIAAWCSV